MTELLYSDLTEKIRQAAFEVHQYFADLIVENKIIIELKAISNLDKIHMAQVKNYLKATKIKLGLLINFGTPQFKRIILG